MRKRYGFVAAIAAVVMLCGCSNAAGAASDPHPNMTHLEDAAFATPENPVASPSGEYILAVHAGFSDVYYNQFTVCEEANPDRVVFSSDEQYRTRDRLYFCWDEDDNIWVYSGDTGAALWRLNTGNQIWVEEYSTGMAMPTVLEHAIEG